MKEVEAIRVSRTGVVTLRFFTVGVPEMDLKDVYTAVTKKR